MKKFFVNNYENNIFRITGGEFDHLKKVLRCKEGENIICLNGDGNEYLCEILKIENGLAEAKLLKASKCKADPKINLTVYQALPKGDKFDFLIQKLSEVGVSSLVPFESEFTIAKAKDKLDRQNKIAIEACKQCGRSVPLKIEAPIKFKELLSRIQKHQVCYFAYEKANNGKFLDIEKYSDIAIIVGSEGGFSEKEAKDILSSGAKELSLGDRILRCETASLVIAGTISYLTNN